MMVCVAVGDIGKRFREARESGRPALSQFRVAELLDVSQGRLSNWERGVHDPPADVIAKAAEVFNRPIGWFYGDAVRKPPEVREVRLTYGETGYIPIRGFANAGDTYSPDPMSEADPLELAVPIEFSGPDHSGVVVSGDSMLPYLHPGDVLVFKDRPNLFIGRIVLAEIDGMRVIKKAVWRDGAVALESFNPTYKPMNATGARCLGYLVGIVAANGSLKIGPEDRGIDETYFLRELGARLGLS